MADRPVTPRRRATRDRLLEAATEVFAEKGFGAATVDNVCAAAGFTRGAFYSNFASLTEVFVELYERRTAEVVERIRVAAAEVGEVTTASVAELVSAVLDHLPDDRRWRVVQAEFTAHALRDPEAARALAAPRAAVAAALRP
ncbi:TetR/AcrR family transcriptional regulator, partial [Jatrophihabitans sp. YIM 134969]